MHKKGISLITLAVTIIVLAIIAGIIVSKVSENDSIDKAATTVEDANYKNMMDSVESIYTSLETMISLGKSPLAVGQTVSNYIKAKLVAGGISLDEVNKYIITDEANLIKKVYPVKGDESLWTYTTNADDTLTITAYTGTGDKLKDIVIPNTIVVGGVDKRVTKVTGTVSSNIGTPIAVFVGNLTISEGIEEILDGAFYGCMINRTNPGELKIADTVKVIGNSAFGTCNRVTNEELILPRDLEILETRAFFGCMRQDAGYFTLKINKKLKSIGVDAFLNAEIGGEIVIPGNVKNMAGSIFYNNSQITSVKFEEGIEVLGGFLGCRALSCDIIIPSSVKEITMYAFSGCTGLEGHNLVLKEGLKTIGVSAFYNCRFKGTITIPSTVRTIKERAFDCALMSQNEEIDTKLVIKEGVQVIERSAFSTCDISNQIVIPSTVTSMGESIFGSSEISGSIHVNKTQGRCASWPSNWYANNTNVIPTYK